jgi:hypothetical protein
MPSAAQLLRFELRDDRWPQAGFAAITTTVRTFWKDVLAKAAEQKRIVSCRENRIHYCDVAIDKGIENQS